MKWLRQSTAVTIDFGPAVDPADGVTLVTSLVSALDHVSTGIVLSKNGGTNAVRNLGSAASPSAVTTATTYDSRGKYKVALDTVDTNTLGHLRALFENSSLCLPMWEDFTVVPAMIYDSLILGTDKLQVDAVEFNSDAIAAAAAALLAKCIGFGSCASGCTTTSIRVKSLNINVADVDQLKGKIINFPSNASASMRIQGTDITASSAVGSPEIVVLTVTQLTNAPVVDEPFVIT